MMNRQRRCHLSPHHRPPANYGPRCARQGRLRLVSNRLIIDRHCLSLCPSAQRRRWHQCAINLAADLPQMVHWHRRSTSHATRRPTVVLRLLAGACCCAMARRRATTRSFCSSRSPWSRTWTPSCTTTWPPRCDFQEHYAHWASDRPVKCASSAILCSVMLPSCNWGRCCGKRCHPATTAGIRGTAASATSRSSTQVMSHADVCGNPSDVRPFLFADRDTNDHDEAGRGGLSDLDLLLPPPRAEPQLLQPAGWESLLIKPAGVETRKLVPGPCDTCSYPLTVAGSSTCSESRSVYRNMPTRCVLLIRALSIQPLCICEVVLRAGDEPPAPVGPPVRSDREHAVGSGAVARHRHRGAHPPFMSHRLFMSISELVNAGQVAGRWTAGNLICFRSAPRLQIVPDRLLSPYYTLRFSSMTWTWSR